MRTLFFVWFITISARLAAGETAEVPVAVYTQSGSRLHGMLQSRPVVLRKAEGGTLNLDWSTVKSISFGERLDPNLENDALIAINDLGSDKFEVRSAAQTKLRSLGHAAYRALKTAAASGDAETAARAKAMMAELAGRNAADRSQDEFVFTDGKTARGELSSTEALVRTRYGMLAFAAQAVVKIEGVPKSAINLEALVDINAPPQNVDVAAVNEKPPEAERWDPVQEAALGEGIRVAEAENIRAVTMEQRPKPGAPRQALAIERGTRLDDAYSDWGAVMHSSDAAANVVATDAPGDQVFGGSGHMALKTMAADLEIDFIKPGSFDPNTGGGRPGGVRLVGAIVRA
jgi:hypothetical protein